MAGDVFTDARTGRNGRHALVGMLRQAVSGRLAGYEDVNDAERLRHDPAKRWIAGGKGAIKWTRLSCRSFAANAVRLQLHALACNPGNFLRTPAAPEPIKDWSMATLRKKLIKIGAKVACHARYVSFQMAEVAIPRNLFAGIPPPVISTA